MYPLNRIIFGKVWSFFVLIVRRRALPVAHEAELEVMDKPVFGQSCRRKEIQFVDVY